MSGSCFAEYLSHYVALTEVERAALARLEENKRDMKRGDILQREGDPADEIYVVNHGRLMSYVHVDDGSRQILRLYYAGDSVGTGNAIYSTACETIVATEDAIICPFEKDALKTLLGEHPRVAALLFALNQAERVALTDRLASIGRTSAKSRVAAVLLDILQRLRIMTGDAIESFDPRLTQEELGDATGLTSVHVNRMLRELTEEKVISRKGSMVRVIDEARMREVANYIDRFADLDFSWLPAARN